MFCGMVLRGSWGSIHVPALLAPKCVCVFVCVLAHAGSHMLWCGVAGFMGEHKCA